MSTIKNLEGFPHPIDPETIKRECLAYIDAVYPPINIMGLEWAPSELVVNDTSGFGDLYVTFIEQRIADNVYLRLEDFDDEIYSKTAVDEFLKHRG